MSYLARAIRIRFAWSTLMVLAIVWAGLVGIALAVGGLKQIVDEGPASGGFAVVFLLVLVGALAAINFIFFDCVSIDDAECRQVGWFGLRRKALPISEVREIRHARKQGRHMFFDLVVIQGLSHSIELNMEYRWPGEVRKAVRYLVSRGVPADEWVTQSFAIDGANMRPDHTEGGWSP